jgi:hypothetical protein
MKFTREEAVKTSMNPQLVGIGLVISVDCDHETGVDHILSASATHHVTQVVYVAMHRYIMKKDKILLYVIPVYICMYAKN